MASSTSIDLASEVATLLGVSLENVRVNIYGDDIAIQVFAADAPASVAVDYEKRLEPVKARAQVKFGKNVWVAVIGQQSLQIKEQYLLGVLNGLEKDKFTDVVFIEGRDNVRGQLLVFPASELSAAELNRAKSVLEGVLRQSNEPVDDIKIVGYQGNLPGVGPIIRHLKIHEPCTLTALCEALKNDGYSIPPDKWLLKQLDILRNRGMITISQRRSDEHGTLYALTSRGLMAVPHQTGRVSSDVARALGFRWRKW